MNKREKEAREKLVKLRGSYGEAVRVTKKGGRDVDNFDAGTEVSRNPIRNISDAVKTFRQGR